MDAGPLVALVDADDQYHERCVSTLKSLQEPLATVWPPLTEAMYLLNDLPAAQDALWEMLVRKALQLLPLGLVDLPRIRELRRKYADRPMDLADAALIRIAEREGVRKIFTADKRDFAVYRIHGRIRPSIIP
ncbi:MAG TPA: PIN domain-containing protein [Terriglobales bacterium]|nr:PIN domain-containing protein [Terriglobales bacterium]